MYCQDTIMLVYPLWFGLFQVSHSVKPVLGVKPAEGVFEEVVKGMKVPKKKQILTHLQVGKFHTSYVRSNGAHSMNLPVPPCEV